MREAIATKFADFQPTLVSMSHGTTFESCISALVKDKDFEAAAKEEMNDNYWVSEDHWASKLQPYVVRNGTLIIPIRGVLLHNFPWQFYGYATGYEYIWQAFKRGMADPEVKRIALRIHSPGGEVAGCFECVDKMFELRGTKPVQAFAHEYAYSAAYALASVADKICMSRTGGVGSIGVVTAHIDMSKMMSDWGLKVTFISAPEGGHKTDGNPYEALKPETKARIQARIDDLYGIFVSTVSRNRPNLSEEDVRETKALTFSAPEAIENGLADEVAPLDVAEAAFAASLDDEEEDEQMADKTDKTDATFDQAAVDSARAAGVEEGKTAGKAEGRTEERARINGILNSEEGKARPKAALSAAMKTEMSVDQAKEFLSDLPTESGQTQEPAKGEKDDAKGNHGADFKDAMSKDKPDVGADAEGKDEDDSPSALAKGYGLPGF